MKPQFHFMMYKPPASPTSSRDVTPQGTSNLELGCDPTYTPPGTSNLQLGCDLQAPPTSSQDVNPSPATSSL